MALFSNMRRGWTGSRAAVLAAGLLLLTGCTWFGGPVEQAVPGGAPGVATIGSGEITVGLIAADEPDNPAGGSANAVFIAANMANDRTKDRPVRVLFRRYDGNPATLGAMAGEMVREGAKLVIGPDDPRAGPELAKALAVAGVPVVLLASEGGDSTGAIYAAGPPPQVEASVIAAEMQARGYKSIVLFADESPSGRVLASLIAQSANNVGIAATTINATDPPAARKQLDALAGSSTMTSAMVFATNPEVAIRIMQEVHQIPALADLPVVGNAVWAFRPPQAALVGEGWYPALAGNRLAAFSSDFALMSGAAPTMNAAIAHDLLVLAAVVPRIVSDPAVPYPREILINDQGFTGVTGAFRFGTDGRSLRTLTITELD